MHTGKMYMAGRADAFKECHDLITKLMDSKEDCLTRQEADGTVRAYYSTDMLETYRMSLELLIGACSEETN